MTKVQYDPLEHPRNEKGEWVKKGYIENTKQWQRIIKNGNYSFEDRVTKDGKVYAVDGINVLQDHKKREKEIAEILSKHKKSVKLLPRITGKNKNIKE